jgi:hypothetical protein
VKQTNKLIRRECYGGPLDGKWVTVADWQDRFLVAGPGVIHAYEADEVYEPQPRTIYRHREVTEARR